MLEKQTEERVFDIIPFGESEAKSNAERNNRRNKLTLSEDIKDDQMWSGAKKRKRNERKMKHWQESKTKSCSRRCLLETKQQKPNLAGSSSSTKQRQEKQKQQELQNVML